MNKDGLKFFKKQPAIRKVIYALLLPQAGAVYYFGWRTLAVTVLACAAAVICEYIFCRYRKEPVSEAVFVTAMIYGLILPPTVPWHVVIIGICFAIIFSKEVFGGFGRNIFNPAVAGRCFVYICFPVALTGTWAPPAQGHYGALDQWSTFSSPDAITSATPMAFIKAGSIIPVSTKTPDTINYIPYNIQADENVNVPKLSIIKALLIGRISGTAGVTSAILCLIGGSYLFYKKIANRTTIIAVIATYVVWNLILTAAGLNNFYGAAIPLLGGGFLFGAFYMATDPVSSPRTNIGRMIYGFIIGTGTMVIRNFSIFNGGLMFSILLGNMFAPIADHFVKQYKQKPASRGETT